MAKQQTDLKQATQTWEQLQVALEKAVRYPHKHIHKGKLILTPEVFDSPGRGTNVVINSFALLDCTGSIEIGAWTCISPRARIYTHDHLHYGQEPLFTLEEKYGVLWQDKRIGRDVWIHDSVMVLYQVTEIPDGVVVGGGSVLTKNPGPYEIWAGNPARKIGMRKELSEEQVAEHYHNRTQFRL